MSEILQRQPDFLERLQTPPVQTYLRDAQKNYFHWEQLRHRPVPAGLTAESLWIILRAQRSLNARALPFTDTSGQNFSFWLPEPFQSTLHFIDRNSGSHISQREAIPEHELQIIAEFMDEGIASGQLEGASTTTVRAQQMLRFEEEPETKDERMIWNNYQTMRFLSADSTNVLTPEFVLRLHKLITKGTLENERDAGRLRSRNDIAVVDNHTQEIIHQPPVHQILPHRLQQLCDFANADAPEEWIHPVVKATLLHFWLAYDHPFVDGNGRTARVLFYWYLLSRGYWLFKYLPISHYFLQAPAKYRDAFLKTETDGGDLTYFLQHNLEVVKQSLAELHQRIAARSKERKYLSSELQINVRQRALLLDALRSPDAIYTLATHGKRHAISYGTARSDLLDLAARGFLMQKQRGKAFVFTPVPDLKTRLGQ